MASSTTLTGNAKIVNTLEEIKLIIDTIKKFDPKEHVIEA